MKKTALAVIFILALLLSAVTQRGFIELVNANPFAYEAMTPPVVRIYAPINETGVSTVLLNFTIAKPTYWASPQDIEGFYQHLDSVIIEIDGKHYDTVGGFDNLTEPYNYWTYLTNVTEGPHNLTVCAKAYGFSVEMHGLWKYYIPINSSSVAHFILDSVSPQISISSIQNKTYFSSDLQLNFTTSEAFYNASYVLDGQNIGVAENSTLSNLRVGSHNLTVYAYDYAGNIGASETIFFTIAEPFPTTLVIVSIVAVVALVGLGLLVHLKKRRR
jgi:hypothetical protein